MADDKEWLPKGAADEKGWWEEDPEAETEVEETGVEVKAGPVLSGKSKLMVVLFMLYLFYWMETSDSIFAQLCCGPLFWLLYE